MSLQEKIIEILKDEVVPAMGCTEPVAVALACAKLKEVWELEEIGQIEVLVSPNIYKNGLGVGVPNTNEAGLDIAAALGIVAGRSSKGLEVLEDITKKDVIKAHKLIRENKLKIIIKDTKEKVYIEANMKLKNINSRVIIQDKHSNFTYIEKNKEIIYEKKSNKKSKGKDLYLLKNQKITDIIKAIEAIDYKKLEFLLEGIEMNENIALKGLNEKLGIGVGYSIKKSMDKGLISKDLINDAMMFTAAGADARMSGVNMPVMSSNGSGNNGLTAILPIVSYKRRFNETNENLIKALAISHIINCYIKSYIGRLSALCGCSVAASTGSSAAITWLMGGDYNQINGAIKNMIANISGMICDGAKGSCALKVSTSASVAIQSAILAIDDSITFSKNGIIAETVEDTIKNLGTISKEGMDSTDGVILDIMKNMA